MAEAARFTLAVACDLRTHLGLPLALDRTALLRDLPLLEEVLAAQYQGEPLHDVEFFRTVPGARGAATEETVTLRSLRRLAHAVGRYSSYCAGCAYAALRTDGGEGAVMGCHVSLSLPIPVALDTLLALSATHLVSEASPSPAAGALVRWAHRQGTAPLRVIALRAEAGRYFVADAGPAVLLPGSQGSLGIDRLWEVLLQPELDAAGSRRLVLPFLQGVAAVAPRLSADSAMAAPGRGSEGSVLRQLQELRDLVEVGARLGVPLRCELPGPAAARPPR